MISNLIEGLRDIEKNCCAVSTCFHIVVYFFNNYMNLLYDYVFTSETKLVIGNQSIIIEILGSRSFSNSFDRTESKLIDPYDSARFYRFARLLNHNNLYYHLLERSSI